MEIQKCKYKEIEYKEKMLKSEWDKLTDNQKEDIYTELKDFIISRYKVQRIMICNVYEIETQYDFYIKIRIKMIVCR